MIMIFRSIFRKICAGLDPIPPGQSPLTAMVSARRFSLILAPFKAGQEAGRSRKPSNSRKEVSSMSTDVNALELLPAQIRDDGAARHQTGGCDVFSIICVQTCMGG
jgi:hypothetical protein